MRFVNLSMAALIVDLKRLGLLDSTLIIWGGEFGRSPDNGLRGGATTVGRDHNAQAMALWFAGGGIRKGHIVGATDELGDRAVEIVHPLKDLHVTLLHLLGLNDNRLTYTYGARIFHVAVNGSRGRMAGEYPKSFWKVFFLVVGIIILVIIVLLSQGNQ